MTNSLKLIKAQPYPLGLTKQNGMYHVSFVIENAKECGIMLYIGDEQIKLPFSDECRMGNLYSALIVGDLPDTFSYHLYKDDVFMADPNRKFIDNGDDKDSIKAVADNTEFDWKYEVPISYSYSERNIYMIHVKSFTKHKNSQVNPKDRGTFNGVIQKIMYMKSLGITTVLMMPIYSFEDKLEKKNENKKDSKIQSIEDEIKTYKIDFNEKEKCIPEKINYWGYADGNYYLPNKNYAATDDAILEFKNLVMTLHGSKMEIFLQFYFDGTKTVRDILDILIFWKMEYHIDGFELIGPNIPINEIANEPALADTPILTDRRDFSRENQNHLIGYMNHDWMRQFRCFLKGDNHSGYDSAVMMKNGSLVNDRNSVHYIAKQNTMRLMDMVSYHDKHNEDNGENNCDGENDNYSWNCGIEGATKKRAILSLREKQMKNALCFVYLTQGIPLLYCGDEFGNTQFGNNNPYCQDNEISYVKWSTSEAHKRMILFVKKLNEIRKNYPIIRGTVPYKGTDYLSVGYPDFSVHGDEAWKHDLLIGAYHFGILYNNQYAEEGDNSLIYVGYNMHWESHELALPNLVNRNEWKILLSTDDGADINESCLNIPARSVVIAVSEEKN